MTARTRRYGDFKKASPLIRSHEHVGLWPAPFTRICLPLSSAEKSLNEDASLPRSKKRKLSRRSDASVMENLSMLAPYSAINMISVCYASSEHLPRAESQIPYSGDRDRGG